MVIDDDRSTLDVVSIILESHGYEPIVLSSAHNIIEKIKEHKPKVILLDVHLGSTDSRVLCKEIKEIEDHSTTPIILFSANTEHVKSIKDYLCDDFIEKPFELTSLLGIITHSFISLYYFSL